MRVEVAGETPHDPVIKRAIDRLCSVLPGSRPHRVWQIHELLSAVDGRRHPVGLLVLTQNGLWVIHVERRSGVLQAEPELWRWQERTTSFVTESPFRELDDLTRRITESLRREGWTRLDVRPLVLLGGNVALDNPRDTHRAADLVTLPGVQIDGLAAITDRLLAHPTEGRALAHRHAEPLGETLVRIGVRPASYRRVVGGYRLGELLADHDVWQEHRAVMISDPSKTARVRSWVLPRIEDPARREALRRAATREAEVLGRLGRHPNILGLIATEEQAELPRLLFESFEDSLPLHQFLRAHRDLSFEHRLDLLEKMADALDHCHRNEITHRNLSPDSVLVRARDGEIEVRLHRFEGAVARQAEATTLGTRHLTHFTERIDDLYRAPEVYRDPDAADEQSDLFSLGALAWYLFTGRHPGPTLADRAKQLRDDEGLRLWRVRDDLDDELDDAISAATREAVSIREEAVRKWAASVLGGEREPTIRTWINGVLGLYRDLDDVDGLPVDPLRATPGDPLGHGLVAESVLGSGASARVLSVWSDGLRKALKVPHDSRAARMLEAEAGVLNKVEHPGVVRLDDVLELSGRPCLLMQHAGDETLGDFVRKSGTLALDYVNRLGGELLDVLVHLHELGITTATSSPATWHSR